MPELFLGNLEDGGIAKVQLRGNEFFLIADSCSSSIASLIAYSANESGIKCIVLDLDGSIISSIGEYFDVYDSTHIIYDSLSINVNPYIHAELVSSAYSYVLGLDSEGERILRSALYAIAMEEGEASPVAIAARIPIIEGFRATKKQDVEGAISSLRGLNVTGEQDAIAKLINGSCIVNFSSLPSYEFTRLGALLFMSKLLAILQNSDAPFSLLISNCCELILGSRIPRDLIRALLISRFCKVLSSCHKEFMAKSIIDLSSSIIFSSDSWNMQGDDKIPSNMLVLYDARTGSKRFFLPRYFEMRGRSLQKLSMNEEYDNNLRRAILEIVESSDSSTRVSIASILSSNYKHDKILREIDRLQAEGYIAFVKPSPGIEGPLMILKITELGKLALRELKGNG